MTTTPYTNPMDGATRESLMRCAANAMARAELAEDECENLQESIMKHASKDAKQKALLEAEISKRQNEINEWKEEDKQWRKRFNDAMELLRGSQATAESSYQRAKMIADERDALKAEVERMKAAPAEPYRPCFTCNTHSTIVGATECSWCLSKTIDALKAECAKLQSENKTLRTAFSVADDQAEHCTALVMGLEKERDEAQAECAKLREELKMLKCGGLSQKPFLYGMAYTDGKPVLDEICVAEHAGSLTEEADAADANVLPLYTGPQVIHMAERADTEHALRCLAEASVNTSNKIIETLRRSLEDSCGLLERAKAAEAECAKLREMLGAALAKGEKS